MAPEKKTRKRKLDSDDVGIEVPTKPKKRNTITTTTKSKDKSTKSSTYQNLLNHPMTPSQRKTILKQFQSNPEILDSLRRPEMLMDFFTDCLNTKDLGLAVPALSGLFHLITLRNLDYPHFFVRLYSLLDRDLLHSKHRSRFLRHLETFLNPTNHLPSSMIASFIKRLSRLSLFAPPAAIVAVVPFIYNLLKQHPTTTFMIHRHPYPPYVSSTDNLGSDPYDPREPNPQLTNAIESSLWELDTLRSHYHPQVAGVTRIIAEQFTKQTYQVEDFLDHGYASLLEAELGRSFLTGLEQDDDEDGEGTKGKREGRRNRDRKRKGETVVEYKIPKKIFGVDSSEQADLEEDDVVKLSLKEKPRNLLLELWSF